jgi:hypothetical protein
MSKTRAKKAALLGIATTLIPSAVQKAIAASYYQAGVALALGFGALWAYEHLQIRQIPASAEDFKDLSEDVGDAVKDRVEGEDS